MGSVNGDIMASIIMLVLYLISALLVGIKLYRKVDNWLSNLDRITPEVSTGGP